MPTLNDLVKGKRSVSQDAVGKALGLQQPASDADRSDTIDAINQDFPGATVIPTTKIDGTWEINWGIPSDTTRK